MRKAILLLAWGAGSQTARVGLLNFETNCRNAFPDWHIRWAYTSSIFRNRSYLQKRKSDSVTKALLRLKYERFSSVAIQPLHLIPGKEYENVRQSVFDLKGDCAISLSLGSPLLEGNTPMKTIAKALIDFLPPERKRTESVIYMGHGGKCDACSLYEELYGEIASIDRYIHIGTMGGKYNLDNIINRLQPGRVWLLPLLATIGRHALEDMAGDDANSWKMRIINAGFECKPVLHGLVESEHMASFWIDNLKQAIEKL